MSDLKDKIFALDIGTRTVVGLLLGKEQGIYKIISSQVITHNSRAMYDGQIHDIQAVTGMAEEIIAALEEDTGYEIEEAGIAAAGRALKTAEATGEIDFSRKKKISSADVRSLEYAAVQKAREKLLDEGMEDGQSGYHFVGMTVKEYRVDGIFVREILHQQGRNIEVDIIATFLPRIVVDSLLSVMDNLGLRVSSLTLEPMAASRIVIPGDMYNFNLALVDIGAGTADIAVTKGGSMKGFGMVPVAGDEITETIAEKFMIDYHQAEEIKCRLEEDENYRVRNALGSEIEIKSEDIRDAAEERVKEMAGLVGEEIKRLNGGAPRGVICIGGGSLIPGFTDKLAGYLKLDGDRVGIRNAEDLKDVEGRIDAIAGSQMITPAGIGVMADSAERDEVFIQVEVNGEMISLFALQEPEVKDAILQADVDPKQLRPRPGRGLTYTLNGEVHSIPGEPGDAGRIILNGENAKLDTQIENGDVLEFHPGEEGADAEAKIGDVLDDEDFEAKKIIFADEEIVLEPGLKADGRRAGPEDELQDGMEIEYSPVQTVADAVEKICEVEISDLNNEFIEVKINGEGSYLPRSEIVLTDGDNPLDLDEEITSEQEIFLDRRGPVLTVRQLKNFLQENRKGITIEFNSSRLQLSKPVENIRVNGSEQEEDYQLKSGDVIEYECREITVDEILKHINYGISRDVKDEVSIIINGSEADFSSSVSDSDEIEMRFS